MPETPLPSKSLPRESAPAHKSRFIYLACPWSPMGGGMFRVADYLIQAQATDTPAHAAQLRPLDTRGPGHAALSLWYLLVAVARIAQGRLQGELAGVHVNMAERLSVWRKGVIIAACRALGVPVLLHLHAAQMQAFYAGLPAPLKALTRWIFRIADGVVVLGEAARRFVTEELGVSPERVDIVINGVPEPAEPRRVRKAGTPQRLLFLGNLSERKGVPDLLRALAMPGFETLPLEVSFAGGGDVALYQATAHALGIDHLVRFEGWCDQARVAALMSQADLMVLPSHDEGLPLAILEALGNGVAVVCTPVGEIGGVLSDGVDALFVRPGDSADIAERLLEVLRSPALRERLERNGRARYEAQFSLPRFFGSIARIHQRCFGIAGQPPPPRATPGPQRP